MSAVEERRHEYHGVCPRCGVRIRATVTLYHIYVDAPTSVYGYCRPCATLASLDRQPAGVTT